MKETPLLKTVRLWRICRAEPSGSFMWFDPSCEYPLLASYPGVSGRELSPPITSSFPQLELMADGGVETYEGGDSDENPIREEEDKRASFDDLPF